MFLGSSTNNDDDSCNYHIYFCVREEFPFLFVYYVCCILYRSYFRVELLIYNLLNLLCFNRHFVTLIILFDIFTSVDFYISHSFSGKRRKKDPQWYIICKDVTLICNYELCFHIVLECCVLWEQKSCWAQISFSNIWYF